MSRENSKTTELETESKNRQRVNCLVKRGESKSLGLEYKLDSLERVSNGPAISQRWV